MRSPGQMDRQVVASGRKLNLRREFRWVVKRTRKFPRMYTQVAKKKISSISLAKALAKRPRPLATLSYTIPLQIYT